MTGFALTAERVTQIFFVVTVSSVSPTVVDDEVSKEIVGTPSFSTIVIVWVARVQTLPFVTLSIASFTVSFPSLAVLSS